ncbi:MAG: late competence development ComFB family protein [Oscillospiraceae bacterium]
MFNENITKEEQSEMILANTTEELVRMTVDEVISKMDMCSCEICKLNACAIALNNLEPHYVTTTRGRLIAKIITLKMNHHTEVLVEVTKALLIVKKNPLH